MLPNLPKDHRFATTQNSFDYAKLHDSQFASDCATTVASALDLYLLQAHQDLRARLPSVPQSWKDKVPFHALVDKSVPVHAIKARTEKLLWHQRLGHPCDRYLYDAHKYIDGVPKFTRESDVLSTCPTCVIAKQAKSSPGSNSTRAATEPYQGLSIDFSFAGVASKNSKRRVDYAGLHGETCWILVTDHFTGMKHGDSRVSKAAPVEWLRHFLSQHSPTCDNKYVHVDQGGELFQNPDIVNLFQSFGYELFPTGADASHQNAQVERAHRTLSNSMRALLSGANLDVKFWPYAFYHSMRLSNAFPEPGESASPIEKATGHRENLSNLKTFGCRVHVRPPGKRSAKLIPNSRKGIFLGFVPYTTRNILWYDVNTSRVKIATHARFDEGMNDLPVDAIPPNVQHLQRTEDGLPFQPDDKSIGAGDFCFHITPFAKLLHKSLVPSKTSSDPSYGFALSDDALLKR